MAQSAQSAKTRFFFASIITGGTLALAVMGVLNLAGLTRFRLPHAFVGTICAGSFTGAVVGIGYWVTEWEPPTIALPNFTKGASPPPTELEAMMQRLSTRGQHPLAATLLARQLRGESISVEEIQAVERLIQQDLEYRRLGSAAAEDADQDLDFSGLTEVAPAPVFDHSLASEELPEADDTDPWSQIAPPEEEPDSDWAAIPMATTYTPPSPPPAPAKVGEHLPNYMDV